MNKVTLIVIAVVLVVGIGIIIIGPSKDRPDSDSTSLAQNVEIRDGVQYISINARGGYSPRISSAQADIPTKLIIKTNGTYDCSLALVIRSIDYQKILPNTGEEIIDLDTPQAGTFRGMCSMGMYSFAIDFK